MLITIVQKAVNYWVDNEIVEESDRDIYEYGFELILTSVINVVAVIITSIFVTRLFESIALLAVIIPLQSCGGGYHATTHLRCFLIMYIGWWPVMWIIPHIGLLSGIVIACVSLGAIFVLAPISHENAPLSDKQFHKMKVLVRCFSVAAAVIGIAALWIAGADNNIGDSIIIGMGVVAVSMIAAKLRNYVQKI